MRKEGQAMKKTLAILVATGLLASTMVTPASAGDRGWATTGKILTGIIGLNILGHALAAPYYGYPYYAYPPPAYAYPPRTYYPREQVWVPGHYETRIQRRWIPGHWEFERS